MQEFGENPPQCPVDLDQYIPYPSVFITFLLIAILALAFAVVCIFKYNSVNVFNRKIKTSQISNTSWIVYFFSIFFMAIVVAVQYSIPLDKMTNLVNSIFLFFDLAMHGLIAFSLTLALHHQYKFRSNSDSTAINDIDTPLKSVKPGSPFASKRSSIFSKKTLLSYKKKIGIGECLFFLLFVIYFAITIILFWLDFQYVVEWCFLASYCLQQIPPFFLIIIILVKSYKPGFGPSLKSKIFLAFGAVLGLTSELPLNIWAEILSPKCIFYICSSVDAIHLVYCASMIFYFLFLRSEYRRSMEEFLSNTVASISVRFFPLVLCLFQKTTPLISTYRIILVSHKSGSDCNKRECF